MKRAAETCAALIAASSASDALREGGRHVGGRRLHRVLSTLVVAEIAISLVLLRVMKTVSPSV